MKGVAGADKLALKDAAKRARMPQGEWLGIAIRAQVARERQDAEPGGAIDIIPPGHTGDSLTPALRLPGADDNLVGLGALQTAVDIAERLTKLRADDARPKRLVALIERRARAMLGDN